MKLNDFSFDLPERLIAQTPAPERDSAKLMVVHRATGHREHHIFRDLPEILGPDQFLVINNTRVFPARLRASRPGKQENIEVLLLKETGPREWLALVKPARKAPPGQTLLIGGLAATVEEERESGARVFRFEPGADPHALAEEIGEPPIPPYIQRREGQDLSADKARYQTVYARHTGSVAAPTAGLHFTKQVFQRLADKGVPVCEILLHVGYGTFQPVRSEEITDHRMEPEYYEIAPETALRIRRYKEEGRRLIAVGTTTTRCLEFAARLDDGNSFMTGSSGLCDLFIFPGFRFRMLDGLLTNFHLPRSTLFMLGCAFAGRELLLDCYKEAIDCDYRFYSYGDCMLIL